MRRRIGAERGRRRRWGSPFKARVDPRLLILRFKSSGDGASGHACISDPSSHMSGALNYLVMSFAPSLLQQERREEPSLFQCRRRPQDSSRDGDDDQVSLSLICHPCLNYFVSLMHEDDNLMAINQSGRRAREGQIRRWTWDRLKRSRR